MLGELLELLGQLIGPGLLILLPVAQPGELAFELTHHLDRIAELGVGLGRDGPLRCRVGLAGRWLGHGGLSLVLHGKRALVTAKVCIGVIG